MLCCNGIFRQFAEISLFKLSVAEANSIDPFLPLQAILHQ